MLLTAALGSGRDRPLTAADLRQIPSADDGRRLLTRFAQLSESFISPGNCEGCGPNRHLSTDISYHVVAFDTIRVEVLIDTVDGGNDRAIEPIGKKAPDRTYVIPSFNGTLEGTTPYELPDGSYHIFIFAYDDTGRSERDTLNLVIDRLPPALNSVSARGGINTYRNNETIIIDMVADGPNYSFITNFGTIDSNPEGGTTILDRGDGTYEIRHTISAVNTMVDAANLVVPIIVDDQAGNRTRYNALRFCLSNHPPRLVSVATPGNADGSYRNGEVITVESTWDSPDTLLSLSIDFSALDSDYDSTMLTTARLAGNVYRWTYRMSDTNTFPDGDYQVPFEAKDRGCGSSGLQSVRIRIDTEPGTKPVLDPVPGTVRSPALTVSGLAAASVQVDIRRNQAVVATVPVGEDGRFSADITLQVGANSLVVVGRDNAGNPSEPSTAVSVTYLTGMFITIPTPFRPGGTIQVGTEKTASRLRIEFWTLGGDLASVLTDDASRDLYTVTWDGTDGDGNRLNSGPLIALVLLDFPDGTSSTDKKAMILATVAGR